MEAIKNAIGLGTSEQQGREPVSGVTGSGTAGEPYDQGNVDDSTLGGKAAQHTDPTTDHSINPNVTSTSSTGPYTIGTGLGASHSTSTGEVTSSQGVTPNAASATPSTGAAADPTSTNTTAGPHASDLANKADPRVDSDNDRNTSLGGKSTETPATTSTGTEPQTTSDGSAKTGGIGSKSWFSTAIPFIGGKNKQEEDVNTTTSSASTTQPQSEQLEPSTTQHSTLEDVKSQPPNILPSAVPTGTSTDFAAPGSDPMHAHQEIPGDTVGGNAASAAPSHSLAASRASVAPVEKPDHSNAPLKPAERGGQHGSNPSAIPLAGGKKIGEDAHTERKSFQADATDSSIPPPAAGMGSETSANTARNVGTAEAAGRSSVGEKESVTSGTGSGHSEEGKEGGKEKKSLKEKIKEKVHKH